MKTTMRVLSVLLALMLCMGAMAACGDSGTSNKTTTAATTQTTTPATDATEEAFVAPPDAIGEVVSADTMLITWYAYDTDENVIDFMKVDVKSLGDKATEMSLVYLEEEVTYYNVSSGKLEAAVVEDIVTGCVVGVTTLEEGIQEVYILSVPVEDDGEESEDPVEDPVEETIPVETAPVEETPTDDTSSDVSADAGVEEDTPIDDSATEPTTGDGV